MAQKLATLAKLIEIVKIAIEMRKAQRAWFKDRLYKDLQRSKQLERMFDSMCDGLIFPLEPEKEQQSSFIE